MFDQKELEDLLFLVKSVPMDEAEKTQLVLGYIKRIEEELKEWRKA